MVNILIKTDSKFNINRDRIKSTIAKFLIEKKVKGHVEISISIVGDRMMRSLNKKFRNTDTTTDVLSFPLSADEGISTRFVDPPDNVLRLGDIIISYPQAIEQSWEENKMVYDKIDELIEHGLLHLMGIHHD